jgi:membrane-associated phospholipid phosphatase
MINNLKLRKKEDIIPLLFILSVPMLNVIYTLVNRSKGEARILVTFIDNKIPFVKYFILPYNLWYPFLLISLVYLCLKSRGVFYKTIIAMDVGMLCCYIIYLLFQTTVPRPELTGQDIFTKLVGITYKLDQPYNCFPSIHVLTSYLLIKGFKRSISSDKIIRVIVYCGAITIIFATLFVKQHVVLDIASAVVLGDLLFYATKFIDEEMITAWIKKLYSLLTMKKKLEI